MSRITPAIRRAAITHAFLALRAQGYSPLQAYSTAQALIKPIPDDAQALAVIDAKLMLARGLVHYPNSNKRFAWDMCYRAARSNRNY